MSILDLDTLADQLADLTDPELRDQCDDHSGTQQNGSQTAKFDIDPDDIKKSMGQIVLTVVRLLHELMERQAVRRLDRGSMTDEEAERVGRCLMLQAEEIDRLTEHFGLSREDLNLDLGPLGRLL